MSYTIVPVPQASDEFAAVVRHINPKKDITIHRISAVKHGKTLERIQAFCTHVPREQTRKKMRMSTSGDSTNIDLADAGNIRILFFDYMGMSTDRMLHRIYSPEDAFQDIPEYTCRQTLDLVSENYHHKFDGAFPPDIDTLTKYTIAFGLLSKTEITENSVVVLHTKSVVLPLYIIYFTDKDAIVPEQRTFRHTYVCRPSVGAGTIREATALVQSDAYLFAAIQDQLAKCFADLFGRERAISSHAVEQLETKIYRGTMSGEQVALCVYLIRKDPLKRQQYEHLCATVALFYKGKPAVSNTAAYERILGLVVVPDSDDALRKRLFRILSGSVASILSKYLDTIEQHIDTCLIHEASDLLLVIDDMKDTIDDNVSITHRLFRNIKRWCDGYTQHTKIDAHFISVMVNTVLWMMKRIKGPCDAGPAVHRHGYTIPEFLDAWLDMLSDIDCLRPSAPLPPMKTMNEQLIAWAINQNRPLSGFMSMTPPEKYLAHIAVSFNVVVPDIVRDLTDALSYIICD